MKYNIFVVNSESKEAFIVDSDLSLSVANRLCKRYNQTWSFKYGDRETSLKVILGYCISELDELSYTKAVKLIKE